MNPDPKTLEPEYDPTVFYAEIGVGPENGHYRWVVDMDPGGVQSIRLRYQDFENGKWTTGSEITLPDLQTFRLLLDAAERVQRWDTDHDNDTKATS